MSLAVRQPTFVERVRVGRFLSVVRPDPAVECGFASTVKMNAAAINAALIEHRFKAVGTVVASDIGAALRSTPPGGDLLQTLQAIGR